MVSSSVSMRILVANIDKILTEHRSSHRKRSIKKVFLKMFQILLEEICVGVFFNKVFFFLIKLLNFKNTYLEEYLRNDCICWEYFKKSYWTLPQGFCVLVNAYRFYKLSTPGSIFQYGTLQQIMNNASSLYMTQLARKEGNRL